MLSIPLGWAWRAFATPLPDNLALTLVGCAGQPRYECVSSSLLVDSDGAHKQAGDL